MYGVRVRILIAEDERINQLYMSLVLSAAGHEIAVAGDGLVVLGCLTEQPYDLIFMDIHMPGVDGLEAARRIRAGEAGEDRAHVPIVAVTAYATDDDEALYAGAGINRVAMKPLSEDGLLRIIDEINHCNGENA